MLETLNKSMSVAQAVSRIRCMTLYAELRTDAEITESFICDLSFLGTCHGFSQRNFYFCNIAFPVMPYVHHKLSEDLRSISFALSALLTWKKN